MKRDMDLVRDLLLKIEDADDPQLATLLEADTTKKNKERVVEHLRLLIDEAGFVTGIPAHMLAGKNWVDLKLTWQGHDFLDSVRDKDIWIKTKDGALAAGGFTIDILKDLAKGFIKQQVEQRTGIKL